MKRNNDVVLVSLLLTLNRFHHGDIFYIYNILTNIYFVYSINTIGHQMFASEPIGNIIYLQAVIFEIPN